MWKVIYVASTKDEALELENKLEDQGFLYEIIYKDDSFQVRVPESEADEVYRFIMNNMG